MPPLTVQAHGHPNAATAGNQHHASIWVSVNDAFGAPVSGLEVTNFGITTLSAAPYGSLLEITEFNLDPGLPGFYKLQVRPIQSNVWTAGEYVIGVVVTRQQNRGVDQGQTIVDLLIP